MEISMPDLFFCILGFIIGGLGLLILIVQIRKLIVCRTKISAVITSCNQKTRIWRGKKITDYNPQFQYTVNGQNFDAAAPFSSTNKNKYIPGQTYDLFIDSKHPDKYRFKNEVGLYITGIIMLTLGAFFVVLYFM